MSKQTRRRYIDLNADLGEGFGVWKLTDDDALLRVVSSANVACGFHAGDATTMGDVSRAAAARGVQIGAHVGYRDLTGFGRRALDVDPATLRDEVLYQIGALAAIAAAAGTRLHHVKPHGALYHAAAKSRAAATAVVEAVWQFEGDLRVMGLRGTSLHEIALENDISFLAEGFADRQYNSDGSLVPRAAGGLLEDTDAIVAQAVALAGGEPLETAQGEGLRPDVDTICVHGDTPGSVKHAYAVRQALTGLGYGIGWCAA